jgi:hypothetical protein
MMPGWLFSKAKVNGQIMAWNGEGIVSISMPKQAFSASRSARANWNGNTFILRQEGKGRAATLYNPMGRILPSR